MIKNVYPLYKNIGFTLSYPRPYVKTIYRIIDNWTEIKNWLNNEVIPNINEIYNEIYNNEAENEKFRKNSVSNFKL